MDVYSEALTLLSQKYPKTQVLLNEPMANHTSFHIGGEVPMLIIPDSVRALRDSMAFFENAGVRPLVIGNGTNLLVSDKRLSFPVIKTHGGLENIRLVSETKIYAEAGASLARIAAFARDNALTGFEFAHGIPGSLGGAVYMNAGAYGGEMAQVVTKSESLAGSKLGAEHDFSYRHSAYTGTDDVILSAEIELTRGDREEISAKMQELIGKRRNSQPLELPSAGSTFKRPVGGYAAAMIDECGLKGYTVGGAMVSEKHAGFVVNFANASFDDVMAVISHVRETVYKKLGTELETEVLIIQ